MVGVVGVVVGVVAGGSLGLGGVVVLVVDPGRFCFSALESNDLKKIKNKKKVKKKKN